MKNQNKKMFTNYHKKKKKYQSGNDDQLLSCNVSKYKQNKTFFFLQIYQNYLIVEFLLYF